MHSAPAPAPTTTPLSHFASVQSLLHYGLTVAGLFGVGGAFAVGGPAGQLISVAVSTAAMFGGVALQAIHVQNKSFFGQVLSRLDAVESAVAGQPQPTTPSA